MNNKEENSTFIPITSKNSASDLFNFRVQFSLVDLQKSSVSILDYNGSARLLKFTHKKVQNRIEKRGSPADLTESVFSLLS